MSTFIRVMPKTRSADPPPPKGDPVRSGYSLFQRHKTALLAGNLTPAQFVKRIHEQNLVKYLSV